MNKEEVYTKLIRIRIDNKIFDIFPIKVIEKSF